MPLKFDDCKSCRWRRKPNVCATCDVGELYEDEDAVSLDQVFREPPTRFGESLSDDVETARFDPNRFLDSYEDDSDVEDQDP